VTPPVPPGGATPAPPGAPAAGSPLAVSVNVNVNAAVEALKSMGNYHAEIQRDANLAQKTYTTWTIIQANYTDPGTEDVIAYSDTDGAVFSQDVKKGMTIAILPTSRATSDLSYETQPTYFDTKAELFERDHNMQGRFQMLRDYPNSVKESSGSPAYMYEESGWKIYTFVSNWSYFNWGYETPVLNVAEPVTKRFTDADYDDYMSNIRVELNTSGRLYSLKELAAAKVANGAPVDGSEDRMAMRVVISPGADIGRLKVFNADAFEKDQSVYEKRYFQRHMGGYGRGQIGIDYSDWDHPTMKASKRSSIKVRLIADQGTTGRLGANGITVHGGDGAIHGPPPAATPPSP
jgi:hypothetical protein